MATSQIKVNNLYCKLYGNLSNSTLKNRKEKLVTGYNFILIDVVLAAITLYNNYASLYELLFYSLLHLNYKLLK